MRGWWAIMMSRIIYMLLSNVTDLESSLTRQIDERFPWSGADKANLRFQGTTRHCFFTHVYKLCLPGQAHIHSQLKCNMVDKRWDKRWWDGAPMEIQMQEKPLLSRLTYSYNLIRYIFFKCFLLCNLEPADWLRRKIIAVTTSEDSLICF